MDERVSLCMILPFVPSLNPHDAMSEERSGVGRNGWGRLFRLKRTRKRARVDLRTRSDFKVPFAGMVTGGTFPSTLCRNFLAIKHKMNDP